MPAFHPVATPTAPAGRTAKAMSSAAIIDRLPCITWDKRAGQYACKIGYKYNRRGQRIRDQICIGKSRPEAMAAALRLDARWRKVKADSKAAGNRLPVWPDAKTPLELLRRD